jgi:hypothetical protein
MAWLTYSLGACEPRKRSSFRLQAVKHAVMSQPSSWCSLSCRPCGLVSELGRRPCNRPESYPVDVLRWALISSSGGGGSDMPNMNPSFILVNPICSCWSTSSPFDLSLAVLLMRDHYTRARDKRKSTSLSRDENRRNKFRSFPDRIPFFWPFFKWSEIFWNRIGNDLSWS